MNFQNSSIIYEFFSARVTQINPRWARCHILCVKDNVLAEPFRGQLRREDVRATEKDRVEMYKCYRPNDIILARVVNQNFLFYCHFISAPIYRNLFTDAKFFLQLSLGDAHSYILSTAENELGVVIAYSEEGGNTFPIFLLFGH